MGERVVLHSDLNNCYASIECMLHPELRGKYIAVCGSTEDRHGIVLAKNQLAKQCGADYTVNTKEKDFGEAMTECFGSDKADVIYDCAGNDITMGQAIKYARKGSSIVLVAVFAKIASVDLAVLNDHELTLDTTMMYRHEDFVDAIRLVSEGKIQLKPLMSKHFAFKDYLEAYQYIDANQEKTMKVLIDIDDTEE